MKLRVALLVGSLVALAAACGPKTHATPQGPAPEYEPPRQWTDAGTPAPASATPAAGSAPRS